MSAQFRRQLGITPKLAARRLRFDRVLGRLDASAAIGLADIAAECGYADQSHLSREFRVFAGCAPPAGPGIKRLRMMPMSSLFAIGLANR